MQTQASYRISALHIPALCGTPYLGITLGAVKAVLSLTAHIGSLVTAARMEGHHRWCLPYVVTTSQEHVNQAHRAFASASATSHQSA